MPKMIVSIDGVVIKEVQLTKERTTLGRRPYNDLVIDNLAVSGEHAAFLLDGNTVLVEDLNSTNGTYVNGKAIRRQALAHGDLVEIGKYKIRYVGEGPELQAAAPPTPTSVAAPATTAGLRLTTERSTMSAAKMRLGSAMPLAEATALTA